jgi:hypothetical protein
VLLGLGEIPNLNYVESSRANNTTPITSAAASASDRTAAAANSAGTNDPRVGLSVGFHTPWGLERAGMAQVGIARCTGSELVVYR